jgi:cell division topological specificity factor
MAFFDYFRRTQKSASLAKDRLSIIVARERATTRGGSDYLPQLQQELLAVIARYEKIDLQHVGVRLDSSGGFEVLELNIVLPDQDESDDLKKGLKLGTRSASAAS